MVVVERVDVVGEEVVVVGGVLGVEEIEMFAALK